MKDKSHKSRSGGKRTLSKKAEKRIALLEQTSRWHLVLIIALLIYTGRDILSALLSRFSSNWDSIEPYWELIGIVAVWESVGRVWRWFFKK